MSSLFFYYIIKFHNFNLLKLFTIYYNFAIITAVIGLIQFFSFLIGFKFGYALSWLGLRVMNPTMIGSFQVYPIHSITDEPAGFAFVQAAAIYIAIARVLNIESLKIGNRIQAYIVIISFILSLSSTGYVIIFLSLILLFINKLTLKNVILFILISFSSLSSLYSFVPNFKSRLDTSLGLIFGNIVLETYSHNEEKASGSAIILFNHFIIAAKNFRDHPFGTGVGSHHLAFNRYNTLQTWFTGYGYDSIALNINDACSLFNRLLSELGIIGIGGITFFLYKYFLRNGSLTNILVNHASLVVILAALLRSGHYFIYGLPFFFFSYFYSSRLNNKIEIKYT